MTRFLGRYGPVGNSENACPIGRPEAHDTGFGQSYWHRGDGACIYQEHIAYTQQDLTEPLPYVCANTGYVVSGKLRLDNRNELLSQLRVVKEEWALWGDARLLLACMERWGWDTPNYLCGDFGVTVWQPHDGKLWLLRDPMGVVGLYHARIGEDQIIGNIIADVRDVPDMPQAIDDLWMACYLVNEMLDPDLTPVAAIRAVPPAHILQIDAKGQIEKRCYWKPDNGNVLELSSLEDYAERLRGLIMQSVGNSLRSTGLADCQVGAQLSGGLDSSMIVCSATQLASGNFHTYSWALPEDSDDPWGDERVYIESVLDHVECQQHYIPPVQLETQSNFDALCGRLSPLGGRNDAMMLQAKRDGVRIMLSGIGGDEFVSYNARGYLAELALKGRWPTVWREARLRAKYWDKNFAAVLRSQVLANIFPEWLVLFHAKYKNRDMQSALARSFATEDLLERSELKRRMKAQGDSRRLLKADTKENQLRGFREFMLGARLQNQEAQGRHYGIEFRHPFLDRRIVEFMLSCPPEVFHKDGWPRYLMRRAMAGVAPEKNRWRHDKRPPMPAGPRLRIALFERALAEAESMFAKPEMAQFVDIAKMKARLAAIPSNYSELAETEQLKLIPPGVFFAALFLPKQMNWL